MIFVEPLADPAVMRGLIAALMVGAIVPILGCYVVLKGMAFLGDALAHIILPGVVVALLLDLPLLAGALVAGILAAIAIGAISRATVIKEDTAIGVVFAASLALGIAIMSVRGDYEEELTHILFGEVLGVTRNDLWLMAGLGVLAVLAVVVFYKELLVLSFDRVLATTMQLPVGFLNNLLMVLLALVIVISLQAVGVALVLAMLVTPAAAAYLLTRRLPTMMLWASLIGVVSGVIGLYLSYYLGIASGAAIVLVASGIFGLAYLVAPRRGLLLRRRVSG
jgi:ABC-type Mn2+/Zn2+ transport system permease subunit